MDDIYNFDEFLRYIIIDSCQHQQTNFLKIYPAFKMDKVVINTWIKVFKEVTKDSLFAKKTNALDFLNIGLDNRYLHPKSKNMQELMACVKNEVSFKYLFKIDTSKLKRKISNKNIFSLITVRDNDIKPEKNIIVPKLKIRNIFRIDSNVFVVSINRTHYDLFKKIHTHEFIYKILSKENKFDNLSESIVLFNKLSNLVVIEILNESINDNDRIKIIKKFIEIANKFLETNNFEALFAIVSGLNNMNVQRIKYLWNPERRYTKNFELLLKQTSHVNGFECYRNHVKGKKGIPFIGLVLSNIEHLLQVDIIDKQTNHINFHVYDTLIKIIESYENLLLKDYDHLPACDMAIEYVKDTVITDDDSLYTLSRRIYHTESRRNSFYGERPPRMTKRSNTCYDITQLMENKDIFFDTPRSRKRSITTYNIPKNEDMIVEEIGPDIPKVNSTLTSQLRLWQISMLIGGISTDYKEIFSRKLNFMSEVLVGNWTNGQIVSWLKLVELENCVKPFKKFQIDGKKLMKLNDDYLKNDLLIDKPEDRSKLLNLINLLCK